MPNERSAKEMKLACFEAALRTNTIDKEHLMTHTLDGPDKVLKAAKQYYEWVNEEKTNG